MADSTTPPSKTAPVKASEKQPPKKAVSPPIKHGFSVKKTVTTQKYPLITSYSFHHDIPYEAFIYAQNEHSDGYNNSYKKAKVPKDLPADLAEAGFTVHQRRRIPGSDNVVMKNRNTYDRIVILRIVDSESTPATRNEAMKILKAHFENPGNSQYPAKDVNLVDTNKTGNNVVALDAFFLDDFIDKLIADMYEDEEKNNQFYSKYPDFAKMLWSGNHYSDYARLLGFP
jgi:hypothetical protein